MEFRIADTFTDSLGKLTNEEQKAVKTAAFDLQLNPAHPSLQFHKLDKVRDSNFASIRVNLDIRIIVHRSASSLLLCYVDHHDEAYKWAQRRKLETHPKTGAAQLVEIRETVKEIEVPIYIDSPAPKPPLSRNIPAETLLAYGVPVEWLPDVQAANEDSLLALTDHLPREAAEALLELATGNTPATPERITTDPFNHPDAKRRFRLLESSEELERALANPWEKWTIFLHPKQNAIVQKGFNGPARVSGSAGTGKTIVALHRAVYLAKADENSRVLLTTFSDPLAQALHIRLRRLIGNQPRLGDRIEVHSLDSIAHHLYKLHIGKPKLIETSALETLLLDSSRKLPDHKFSQAFLRSEWSNVVDAWCLDTWESYRDVVRLGRRTRLPENQRKTLWRIFEPVLNHLKSNSLLTPSQLYTSLAGKLAKMKTKPFEHIIVDEAQDLSVAQLKFLASMDPAKPNRLFFAGDLGQRIFEQPFSWKALGVDIRGRSSTLKVNYRTSHQIRSQADRLLDKELSDADGNKETRTGTVSAFNGPEPKIARYPTSQAESQAITEWLKAELFAGTTPQSIGIFVRSRAELNRAKSAVENASLEYAILDDNMLQGTNRVSISTMHLAKGLEFQSVAVMALDEDVIPSAERIESLADQSDIEEAYNTERHLLYVACTRARDRLLLTATIPASEFLDDLTPDDKRLRKK